MRPMPGMVTPATMGWNIVSNSCRPRKYHGAFDGFGVWLKFAMPSSGALTNVEKTSRNAVHTSDATNSPTSRWGHVWTLSVGVALTSWIDPDLTTVSRRWVWPAGPAGAAAVGAPVAAAGRVATAVAVPPPPPSPVSRRAGIFSPS